MKPFSPNKTASRIAEYVRRHPGKTKREIAKALRFAISTVECYIGPLKAYGYIEADKSHPPQYRPGCGVKEFETDASTSVLVGAIRDMVLVGQVTEAI